jgi:hypothetical protein
LTFKLLYCFLIIEHGRRKILHCNVTAHPTSEWVVQQLREAFSEADPYRHAIFDHDSKFNIDVVQLLAATGLKPKRTTIQAPWQNGVAERWIGSGRREMLDRVIPLNASAICDDCFASMRAITIMTAFTTLSIRMHRMGDLWTNGHRQPPASSHNLGSEVCIIAITGR